MDNELKKALEGAAKDSGLIIKQCEDIDISNVEYLEDDGVITDKCSICDGGIGKHNVAFHDNKCDRCYFTT